MGKKMKIIKSPKSHFDAIIFRKGTEDIYEKFIEYLQRKTGFNNIYIKNSFIILLLHSLLDKRLEELRYKLVNKDAKKNVKIIQKLPYTRFSGKIRILEKFGCFKNKKMLKERLSNFNTTRNAFGHLSPTGHADYSKFLQSYDLSKNILTIEIFNKDFGGKLFRI